MQDQLTICKHCESPYCYENITESYVEYNCLQCGFTTNTLMLKGSESLKTIEATLPKFYSEILSEDVDGFIWVPIYRRNPGVGSLYADVLPNQTWGWTFTPEVLVPEELHKEGFKLDYTKSENFKQHEYVLGLMALGVF